MPAATSLSLSRRWPRLRPPRRRRQHRYKYECKHNHKHGYKYECKHNHKHGYKCKHKCKYKQKFQNCNFVCFLDEPLHCQDMKMQTLTNLVGDTLELISSFFRSLFNKQATFSLRFTL